ncbi:MAG TPA: MFS transporter [Spongiibacteraceae bacterium]|nr:MFS transporter [Spongiibacteraceae bacterium]
MSAAAVPYWRLSSFYFFYFAMLGAWLPFWPLYLRELGYGAAAIGTLAGILQGTKIIAPNIWGWLGDRSGERISIIRLGAFAAIAIFSAIFLSNNFVALILIVAGYSFFWNAVHAQFEVVAITHLREQVHRYSLVRVWGSIGFICAVVGLGFYFNHRSVQHLPLFILFLLTGIWCASLLVAEPDRQQSKVVRERGSLRKILREPALIAFLFSCFLLQLSHGPYYTFFSVYLEAHGYARAQTGLLWSFAVVAEVVIFLFMPQLLSRFALRSILLVSLLLAALRWLLIALLVDYLPVLLFAQCLHAASFASHHAAAIEIVRRLFRTHPGQGMALYSGISYGAGAAGGAILSGIFWSVSPRATFIAAALVALVAVFLVRRFVSSERLGDTHAIC